MRGHDHATGLALGSHRDLWTIIEAARHLTLLSAAGTDPGASARCA
jgi:hypothetical protein